MFSTTGSSFKNGSSIDRTSLMGDLRDRIGHLCDGGPPTVQPLDEYDPMMELAEGTGSSSDVIAGGKFASKAATFKRWRYTTNAAKHCITTFDMPYECLEVDPNSTNRRNASVYVEDRKTIWLSIDDVAWAVQYLYTQNQLKGIPMVAANDAGPGAPPPPLAILGQGETAAADEDPPMNLG